MSLNLIQILEITVIITTLLYNYFLIKQQRICWYFGFLASVLGVFIFYKKDLIGQVILHVFYALMALYGWFIWANKNKPLSVFKWNYTKHLTTILFGLLAVIGSFYFIKFKIDHEVKVLDVLITVFCFIATFKEAHKIVSAWLYWIVLNLASMFLYYESNLKIYALLMFVYAIISIKGYLAWKKELSLN